MVAAAEPSPRERWEATQRELWGRRPEDWARLAEPQNLPLIDAALDGARVTSDTALLDAGCGAGLALERAVARGARVTGVDVSAPLLAVARRRVPRADLREQGLDVLPFADATFDAALALNALQFAFDPPSALRELARVLRPAGRLAIGQFAAPERCESTALHEAMEALLPAEAAADHAPYALSAPGALEAALAGAELEPVGDDELDVDWRYADLESLLRGVLCSAGGARAIALVGEEAARAAVTTAALPFRRTDGSVEMHNRFRLVVAARP